MNECPSSLFWLNATESWYLADENYESSQMITYKMLVILVTS